MTSTPFADVQDLLRQRRLERGLPPEPPPLSSARRLLLLGSAIGAGALGLVLMIWALLLIRTQIVSAEIGRMRGVPGQLQNLENQLRTQKSLLDNQTKSNDTLVGGLVAVSSGSALVSQLSQLTPQGVQITDVTVSGQTLSLKGRADDPGAFTKINALSLLLAYEPLFKPDDVRVIKLSRDPVDASKGVVLPQVSWELGAGLAQLKPSQQLPLLRKLGSDGMVTRLQDLARLGVLP